ncbi:YoaK family protein [Pedobacter jamesrossensis]|uniref:YoaK family protein n=1 Tax=Pedobacter jamesrossensis TaxID=1908238 RepID=A0ABV8NP85_9SPHI
MLRHFGVKRTYVHNLKLAVLLSLTAGFVNAAGFLGFSALTTNVTGHAALFAEGIARQDWLMAKLVATWMTLFLAGAFTSSLIVNKIGHNARFSFAIPIILETMILLFCAFSPAIKFWGFSGNFFAGSLLFAMGMQNALVSVISGSVVRTTHLTGTFTDLGIELAQIRIDKQVFQDELIARIKLRVSIIFFFMLGALSGAYLFTYISFWSFLLPASMLSFALLYDVFRLNIKRYYSNFRYHKSDTHTIISDKKNEIV